MKKIKCIFWVGVLLIILGGKDVLALFADLGRDWMSGIFVAGVILIWQAFFLEKKYYGKH